MTPVRIAVIVEGLAEVESVPILIRRLQGEDAPTAVEVAKPFRVKRNRVVREEELERAIQQAVRSRENCKGVLVLLDADDDCPGHLAPSLFERARRAVNLPVAVALAKHEFESWFLGAKESLRGARGISGDATSPLAPEDVRGAKEQLSRNMGESRNYLEVDDQPALTARFDIATSRERCPSLDKFIREFNRLCAEMHRP